ncbi:unnamed protein product [Amoebophrya sp. A120]|nr:unnamed protein product [Amoebophrya sp. A120]|eukprot:GSA120T00024090001.1
MVWLVRRSFLLNYFGVLDSAISVTGEGDPKGIFLPRQVQKGAQDNSAAFGREDASSRPAEKARAGALLPSESGNLRLRPLTPCGSIVAIERAEETYSATNVTDTTSRLYSTTKSLPPISGYSGTASGGSQTDLEHQLELQQLHRSAFGVAPEKETDRAFLLYNATCSLRRWQHEHWHYLTARARTGTGFPATPTKNAGTRQTERAEPDEDSRASYDPVFTTGPKLDHIRVKTCWNRRRFGATATTDGVEQGPESTSQPELVPSYRSCCESFDEDINDFRPLPSAKVSPPDCWNGRQYTFRTCCLNETLAVIPFGTPPPNYSKQWRFVVDDEDLGTWHVREVEFYVNPECTVRATRSVAISSGHQKLHFASNAFDPFSFGFWLSQRQEEVVEKISPAAGTQDMFAQDDATGTVVSTDQINNGEDDALGLVSVSTSSALGTTFGTAATTSNIDNTSSGLHWLGSKLVHNEKVYCVRMWHENLPGVGPVAAQLRDPATNQWVTVRRFPRMYGGKPFFYRLFGPREVDEGEEEGRDSVSSGGEEIPKFFDNLNTGSSPFGYREFIEEST